MNIGHRVVQNPNTVVPIVSAVIAALSLYANHRNNKRAAVAGKHQTLLAERSAVLYLRASESLQCSASWLVWSIAGNCGVIKYHRGEAAGKNAGKDHFCYLTTPAIAVMGTSNVPALFDCRSYIPVRRWTPPLRDFLCGNVNFVMQLQTHCLSFGVSFCLQELSPGFFTNILSGLPSRS